MMSGPQSLTIDASWLHVADGSLSQPDSALVYTITALPQNGTLTVDGTTLASNGQFTQQQIDDGLVVYTENGPGAVNDSFVFRSPTRPPLTSLRALSISAFQAELSRPTSAEER
jgi:hypothetical protein